MSHAKERSIQYDSSLVVLAMTTLLRQGGWTRWPTEVPSNPYHSVTLCDSVIYQPSEDDFLVFLLSAPAHLNRCALEESILEGYRLKSFRNNITFLTQDQEAED